MTEKNAAPRSDQTGAQQPAEKNSSESTAPTLFDAIENRDMWWHSCAMSALRTEAASGRVFGADTLSEVYHLHDPDHPARWGALFRSAVAEGIIRHVDYRPSRRPSRQGGVIATWRGVRR